MKYLFFLVLMINIVFYLWETNSDLDREPVQRELSTTERNNLILLLDELESDENNENSFFKNDSPQTRTAARQVKKKTSDSHVKTEQLEERQTKKSRQKHTQPEPIQKDRVRVAAENVQIDQVQEQVSNENSPELDLGTENSGTVSEAVTMVESNVPRQLLNAAEVQKKTSENQAQGRHQVALNKAPLQELNRSQLSCYEIGPFTDATAVEQWQKEFGSRFRLQKTESREVEEIQDYLVYYPAAETFDQSAANVDMLREHGITDLWLFEQGAMRGSISLGLYLSESSAQRASDFFKNEGLEVHVVPRYQKVQRYFTRLGLDAQRPDKLVQLTAGTDNVQLSACPLEITGQETLTVKAW